MSHSPVNPQKYHLLCEVGLLYSAAIWGSTFFIVKQTLNDVDPFVLVAYRFLLAALLLGGWLAWRGKQLFVNFKPGLVLGGILGVLYLAQTLGLKYITASSSGFITGLFVVFVPFVAWVVFRQAPCFRHLAAVAIAVGGLWLLTGGLGEVNVGELITLLSAVAYALHVVFAGKYVQAGVDPLVLNFQQILVTGLVGLVAALVWQRPLVIATTEAAWSVLFLTLFPTLSAFAIQLVAQRVVNTNRTSLIFTTEPLFAAAFAWTLGNEGLVMTRALGGLLIVVAMLVSEFDLRKLRLSK